MSTIRLATGTWEYKRTGYKARNEERKWGICVYSSQKRTSSFRGRVEWLTKALCKHIAGFDERSITINHTHFCIMRARNRDISQLAIADYIKSRTYPGGRRTSIWPVLQGLIARGNKINCPLVVRCFNFECWSLSGIMGGHPIEVQSTQYGYFATPSLFGFVRASMMNVWSVPAML